MTLSLKSVQSESQHLYPAKESKSITTTIMETQQKAALTENIHLSVVTEAGTLSILTQCQLVGHD